MLNAVTQRDYEGDATAMEALARAQGPRAETAGVNIGTRATVFARQEAAKQSPTPQLRQQMWVANTERHADLDGSVVPLGADWGGIEPGTEPHCACSCRDHLGGDIALARSENTRAAQHSKPHAVINDASGEREGCHETEEEARAQIRALYASRRASRPSRATSHSTASRSRPTAPPAR